MFYPINEIEKIEKPTKYGYDTVIRIDTNSSNSAYFEFVKKPEFEEIEQLKKQLQDTDYKAIKYAEGQIAEEDYAETKAKRQLWRDEINRLENELNG